MFSIYGMRSVNGIHGMRSCNCVYWPDLRVLRINTIKKWPNIYLNIYCGLLIAHVYDELENDVCPKKTAEQMASILY